MEMWPDFQNWNGVPGNLREGLEAYVKMGRPLGGFLTAVVNNDLRDAVARGDEGSLANIRGIMQWLYCQAPGGCWGSPSSVKTWYSHSGLAGLAAHEDRERSKSIQS